MQRKWVDIQQKVRNENLLYSIKVQFNNSNIVVSTCCGGLFKDDINKLNRQDFLKLMLFLKEGLNEKNKKN